MSGCSSRVETAAASAQDPTPVYRPVGNALQTMQWILDPAADVIWDSAGFAITADGETDLSPTTDAGWERVRNSAAVVAETGNLLMMPGLLQTINPTVHPTGSPQRGPLAGPGAPKISLGFDPQA